MAGAIKEYCIRRLADNYVVQAVDAAPLSYLDQVVNRVVMVIDVIVTPYIEL